MTTPEGKQVRRSARMNIKWIAGAAALLVVAYMSRSGFVVYALYAVLLVMLLSRLMTEICLRGLECERAVSRTEMTIGERVDVILTVRNTGIFPIPWVFVEDLIPARMPVTGERVKLLTLMPGQEENMLYQVVLNRRGYHQFGPVLIEAGDLFGFFRRYRTGPAREYITVYPTLEHLMEYDIAAKRPLGAVKVSNRIFEDPTRIIGVREYAPGDPFNRIHWKTTARTGTLHSKVFEPSRVIGATVILDFHRDGYRGLDGRDRGELAVITAASLGNYIASANEQVGLLTNGRDLAEAATWEATPLLGKIRTHVLAQAQKREKSRRLAPQVIPTRKSPEQAYRILRTLARMDYTDGPTLDEILRDSIQHLSRDATMLVITPDVTDDLGVVLSTMKESGFLISLFVIGDEVGYFEAVAKTAPHLIDTYHIKDIGSIAKFATHDIYY
jgi:uncharacterized repeat protein (TIGR01451 family)